MEINELNARTLTRELDWLAKLSFKRMESYLGNHALAHDSPYPPDLADEKSFYADLVNHYKMSPEERIVLLLALVPHIKPHALDIFFYRKPCHQKEVFRVWRHHGAKPFGIYPHR